MIHVISLDQVEQGIRLARRRLLTLNAHSDTLEVRYSTDAAYQDLKTLHAMLPEQIRNKSWVFQSMLKGWYSKR